ncbi:hypothetical protein ACU4HD_10305 [Cupriavidus basilensis]
MSQPKPLPIAPMVIRGTVITDNLVEVGGRGGDLTFLTPDARKYLDKLPLGNPARLADLYKLSFNDILDYAEALGERLDLATNPHLQEACALSYHTAPVTPTMVKGTYMGLRNMLSREAITEAVESTVGIRFLEGWVQQKLIDGTELEVRCFARARCILSRATLPACRCSPSSATWCCAATRSSRRRPTTRSPRWPSPAP